VFQEELLTDLEAQLEEDDDQGMSVSSTMVTGFWQCVQFLSFILNCQERYVRYTWMIGLQLVNPKDIRVQMFTTFRLTLGLCSPSDSMFIYLVTGMASWWELWTQCHMCVEFVAGSRLLALRVFLWFLRFSSPLSFKFQIDLVCVSLVSLAGWLEA